jgi:hypothetical protein
VGVCKPWLWTLKLQMLPTREAACPDVTLAGLTTGAQMRMILHLCRPYGPGSIHGSTVLGCLSVLRIACLNRDC